jgi:LysM repeat protein
LSLIVIAWGARSTVVLAQANTHTVQAGETLALIANRYGVTVAELVAWNDIQDPNLIYVGQVLIVGESTGETPPPSAAHTVQAGETLTLIANRYGVTVAELAAWNDIQDPNLIDVGQELVTSAPDGWTPSVASQPAGGPLSFTWALVDWRPADPDYIATLNIQPQGGQPPYTFYHDGTVQRGDTFEIAWRRCRPKPGSVGVGDASGAYVKEDYWLLAPYCPAGVVIVEPEEGAHLKNFPRNFNITWETPGEVAPPAYGIEIEVWEDGDWRLWKRYTHRHNDRNLFFVPDEFPGDLAGRVRMWGIYGEYEAKEKTPWRNFEFRVTY